MEGLGKGLAIAACAFAIAWAAISLNSPTCFWAFIPLAWIANGWKIGGKTKEKEKDKDDD